MQKLLLAAVVVLLGTGPAAATAAAPTLTPAEAKALLRIASRLSGLPAKRAVPVVVDRPAQFKLRRIRRLDTLYPMSTQSYDEILYRALGLTVGRNVLRSALVSAPSAGALYDQRARRVYVPRGKPARQPLMRAFVHALQDQHFDLGRLRAVAGSRDATLAATGAVEGHATLVAGILATRSPAQHGSPRLVRFLELQRGFTTTVGLRFAVDLRNLGGNRAVFAALRRFPESTEQVFHLDKFLQRERPVPIVLPVDADGLKLVGDSTFGELDVRALLATFGLPRVDRAGSGWGGGRSALYRTGGREAVAVALDWDTEPDAAEWAEAVEPYVSEAFHVGTPDAPASGCATATCWSVANRGIAFVREGTRTVLVVAADSGSAAAVARTIVPAA